MAPNDRPSQPKRKTPAERSEELAEASGVPWVLLSGGVDDATFEAQVGVACAAGASGVVAGRSVWAGAARASEPSVRDEWLRTAGRDRLRRLAELVQSEARPWQDGSNPITRASEPGDGWYRAY